MAIPSVPNTLSFKILVREADGPLSPEDDKRSNPLICRGIFYEFRELKSLLKSSKWDL